MPYNGTSRLDRAIAAQSKAEEDYQDAQEKFKRASSAYKNAMSEGGGCTIEQIKAKNRYNAAVVARATAKLRCDRAKEATMAAMKRPRGKK